MKKLLIICILMLFPLISAELGVFAENTSTASNVSGYTLIIKGLNLGDLPKDNSTYEYNFYESVMERLVKGAEGKEAAICVPHLSCETKPCTMKQRCDNRLYAVGLAKKEISSHKTIFNAINAKKGSLQPYLKHDASSFIAAVVRNESYFDPNNHSDRGDTSCGLMQVSIGYYCPERQKQGKKCAGCNCKDPEIAKDCWKGWNDPEENLDVGINTALLTWAKSAESKPGCEKVLDSYIAGLEDYKITLREVMMAAGHNWGGAFITKCIVDEPQKTITLISDKLSSGRKLAYAGKLQYPAGIISSTILYQLAMAGLEFNAEKMDEKPANLFCSGFDNAETGALAYKKYGFDRILWDWDFENITSNTCENKFCDATQFLLSMLAKDEYVSQALKKIPSEHIKGILQAEPDLENATMLSDLLPITKETVLVKDNALGADKTQIYFLSENSLLVPSNDCNVQISDPKNGLVKEPFEVASDYLRSCLTLDKVRSFDESVYLANTVKGKDIKLGSCSLAERLGSLQYSAKKCGNNENDILILVRPNANDNPVFSKLVDSGVFNSISRKTSVVAYVFTLPELELLIFNLSNALKNKDCENPNLFGTTIELSVNAKDCFQEKELLISDFFTALQTNITGIQRAVRYDAAELMLDSQGNALKKYIAENASNLAFLGTEIIPSSKVFLIGDNFTSEDFLSDFELAYPSYDLNRYKIINENADSASGQGPVSGQSVDSTLNQLESGQYSASIDLPVKIKDNSVVEPDAVSFKEINFALEKTLAQIDTGNGNESAYASNPFLKLAFDGMLGIGKGNKREGYGTSSKGSLTLTELYSTPEIISTSGFAVSSEDNPDADLSDILSGKKIFSLEQEGSNYNISFIEQIPTLFSLDTNVSQTIALRFLEDSSVFEKPLSLNFLTPKGTSITPTIGIPNKYSYCGNVQGNVYLMPTKTVGKYQTMFYIPTQQSASLPNKVEITCARDKIKLSTYSLGSPLAAEQKALSASPQAGTINLITASPQKISSLLNYFDMIKQKKTCFVPSATGFALVWNSEQIMVEIANAFKNDVQLAQESATGSEAYQENICDSSGNCWSSYVPGIIEVDCADGVGPDCILTLNEMLKNCPTAEEIEQFNSDFEITSDIPFEEYACENGKNPKYFGVGLDSHLVLYQMLSLMNYLEFSKPLPWTDKQLYYWFRDSVENIHLDSSTEYPFYFDDSIHFRLSDMGRKWNGQWIDEQLDGGMANLIILAAHEARHAQKNHTCDFLSEVNNYIRDLSLGELGSWGVQYYLEKWMADYLSENLQTYGARKSLEYRANDILKTRFCG